VRLDRRGDGGTVDTMDASLARRALLIGCAVAAVVAIVFVWLRGGDEPVSPVQPPAPADSTVPEPGGDSSGDPRNGVPVISYTPARWFELSIGDGGDLAGVSLAERAAALSDPTLSDLGPDDGAGAAATARAFVTADITGEGRDAFALLFDALPQLRPCENFQVLGAWADTLPSAGVGPYAVAQVLWAGECLNGGTVDNPAGSRVYLQKVNGRWTVVDPITVP
jgi:hypothetical protein